MRKNAETTAETLVNLLWVLLIASAMFVALITIRNVLK